MAPGKTIDEIRSTQENEDVSDDEQNLMKFVKPTCLYEILHGRLTENPYFHTKCLNYIIQAKKKKSNSDGRVIFNYMDSKKKVLRSEGVNDFSCPFCLLPCGSFEGISFHLKNSHRLFGFETRVGKNDRPLIDVTVKPKALTWHQKIYSTKPQMISYRYCSYRRLQRRNNNSIKPLNVRFLDMGLDNDHVTRPKTRSSKTLNEVLEELRAKVNKNQSSEARVNNDHVSSPSEPPSNIVTPTVTTRKAKAKSSKPKANKGNVSSPSDIPTPTTTTVTTRQAAKSAKSKMNQDHVSPPSETPSNIVTPTVTTRQAKAKSSKPNLKEAQVSSPTPSKTLLATTAATTTTTQQAKAKSSKPNLEKAQVSSPTPSETIPATAATTTQQAKAKSSKPNLKEAQVSSPTPSETLPITTATTTTQQVKAKSSKPNLKEAQVSPPTPSETLPITTATTTTQQAKAKSSKPNSKKVQVSSPTPSKTLTTTAAATTTQQAKAKSSKPKLRKVRVSTRAPRKTLPTTATTQQAIAEPSEPKVPRSRKQSKAQQCKHKSLEERQFYHSHGYQPMSKDEVMDGEDSEGDPDDDVADLQERLKLDRLKDVGPEQKRLMYLWNILVRRQRIVADGHVPYACQKFVRLHKDELLASPSLNMQWRFFMIHLWKLGLLKGEVINSCNDYLLNAQEEAAAPSTSRDQAAAPSTSRDQAEAPPTSPDQAAVPATSPDQAAAPATSPDQAAAPATSPDQAAAPSTSRDQATKDLDP